MSTAEAGSWAFGLKDKFRHIGEYASVEKRQASLCGML